MNRIIIFITIMFFMFANFAFAYNENDLSRMEFQKYGQCYEDESLAERLTRLENDYLGMTQSGDIEKRIYDLLTVSTPNKNKVLDKKTFDENVPKKKGKFKQFWDNVSSDFASMGTMTGFIPPITNYGTYDVYDNNGYNSIAPNNYWNNYNSYYPHNSFNHPNYHHHGGLYPNNYHSYNHFNPINNRIINRHNHSLCPHHRYHAPIISPYSHPIIPTQGYTNYSTRSTVRILND